MAFNKRDNKIEIKSAVIKPTVEEVKPTASQLVIQKDSDNVRKSKPVSFVLTPEIHARLKAYHQKTRIAMSKLVEDALIDWMDQHANSTTITNEIHGPSVFTRKKGFEISKAVHSRLKIEAITRDFKMSVAAEDALDKYLTKLNA